MVEIIESYVDEGMEFIWWQVLGELGRQMSLHEAEEWMEQQRQEQSSDEPDGDESDDPEATAGMEAVEGGRHEWR